jgi:hypothetical protein
VESEKGKGATFIFTWPKFGEVEADPLTMQNRKPANGA